MKICTDICWKVDSVPPRVPIERDSEGSFSGEIYVERRGSWLYVDEDDIQYSGFRGHQPDQFGTCPYANLGSCEDTSPPLLWLEDVHET